MSDPLEIPEHVRKCAVILEEFFSSRGIEEWALMGIASRNQIELLRAQLAECQAARVGNGAIRKCLYNFVVCVGNHEEVNQLIPLHILRELAIRGGEALNANPVVASNS